SGDGRYVAFESFASDLVSGDTNNTNDVFVRGDMTSSSPTTTLVSKNSSGTGTGNGTSDRIVISSDGSSVVFVSSATNLVSGTVSGQGDVYARNLTSGAISLVSVNQTGTGGGNYASSLPAPAPHGVISANGSFVIFNSYATNLVNGPVSNLG